MTRQSGTEITDFERVAAALTVRSICTELWAEIIVRGDLQDDTDEAIQVVQDIYDDTPARVVSDGSTVGFVWRRDLDDLYEDHLHSVMERLEPSDFVSADTTILDAVDLFSVSRREYFYVLEKNNVIGILRFSDLYKPIGRLIFLALAFETERLALELCQRSHLRELCWSSLSRDKKKVAKRKYLRHYKRDPECEGSKHELLRELIGFTDFYDKANMISSCRLIPFTDLESIKKHFHKLKKLRNLCAHPSEESDLESDLPREQLQQFVESSKDIYISLKKACDHQSEVDLKALLNSSQKQP